VVEVDRAKKKVQAKRTASLDRDHADHMEGRVILPEGWAGLDNGDYYKHMTAATRVQTEQVEGGILVPSFIWTAGDPRNPKAKNKKPDHHQHASNYCRIAGDIYGVGDNLLAVVEMQ
jgi:hypothetical protein